VSLRITLRRAARSVRGRLFRGGLVLHGPRRPEIALTFDDGPTPGVTDSILDLLKSRNACATFFLLGLHIEKHPDLARRVAEEQEIGCHSYGHLRETVNHIDSFREDTERALGLFDRIIGRRPQFYRFPWGNPGRIAPRDVERLFGMKCLHWSGGGFDERSGEDQIVTNIRASLEPGAILLLHDGCAPGSVFTGSREPTVRAMPRILDEFEASGLRAVTASDLLRNDA